MTMMRLPRFSSLIIGYLDSEANASQLIIELQAYGWLFAVLRATALTPRMPRATGAPIAATTPCTTITNSDDGH